MSDTHKPPASRVIVVTGGSRGIGRRCVERMAADGVSLAIGYASNEAEADAAVDAAVARGAKAIAIRADVGDEHQVGAMFDQAESEFGGIDVVVNAAGRMMLAALVDLDLHALDEMYRTNLRGTFVVDQQAARRMRSGGSILNFSSSVIGRALPTYTAYAATKAAVEAMTFIFAHELRGRNINVNAIAPGPTATDMFLDGKDEAAIARLANAAPLERLGTPDDIAEAVVYITSPAGHWVNGQTIRVNGGVI
jgi:3-oxoacyl-[acyl-carrier protein] reductase